MICGCKSCMLWLGSNSAHAYITSRWMVHSGRSQKKRERKGKRMNGNLPCLLGIVVSLCTADAKRLAQGTHGPKRESKRSCSASDEEGGDEADTGRPVSQAKVAMEGFCRD